MISFFGKAEIREYRRLARFRARNRGRPQRRATGFWCLGCNTRRFPACRAVQIARSDKSYHGPNSNKPTPGGIPQELMEKLVSTAGHYPLGFPAASPTLKAFGFKFSSGGAHISRTMMLVELGAVLAGVHTGSSPTDYRDAILQRNVLGKTTDSTRQKSFRHLRELYALDEAVPIFGLLRRFQAVDRGASLPLLAVQVAWSRDPLFRATTQPVLDASVGDSVERSGLVQAFEAAFPNQYSEASLKTTTQNAASSWAQAGHLSGHVRKVRQQITPTAVAVTMALFLGNVAGYHGAAVFSNPWCRLLDLASDRARAMAQEAHRAGLLNLRAVGEVVELSFPLFAEFEGSTA